MQVLHILANLLPDASARHQPVSRYGRYWAQPRCGLHHRMAAVPAADPPHR